MPRRFRWICSNRLAIDRIQPLLHGKRAGYRSPPADLDASQTPPKAPYGRGTEPRTQGVPATLRVGIEPQQERRELDPAAPILPGIESSLPKARRLAMSCPAFVPVSRARRTPLLRGVL